VRGGMEKPSVDTTSLEKENGSSLNEFVLQQEDRSLDEINKDIALFKTYHVNTPQPETKLQEGRSLDAINNDIQSFAGYRVNDPPSKKTLLGRLSQKFWEARRSSKLKQQAKEIDRDIERMKIAKANFESSGGVTKQ
jgi:anion-transporting  ArsA/GET3 family ATPase